jgi:2-hydroxy-3-oxopropionate reductase
MALNLIRAGYRMTVYSRRRESAEPLVAAGASLCRTPAEVASRSDVIFTMVTGTADVQRVTLGRDGIVKGAAPGAVVVDMSTIAPTATRTIAARLAGRGIDMLDAPVSGGPEGARDATLTIMVGGKRAVFDRIKPLFERLGTRLEWMGDHGAGQTTKACNQLLLLVTAEGVAEALSLAKAGGLDPGAVQKTLMGGLAAGRVLERFGSRMAARNFTAGVEVRLYEKDLGIVLELARELSAAAPAAALTKRRIDALMAQGRRHDDLSSLITVAESASRTSAARPAPARRRRLGRPSGKRSSRRPS